MTWHESRIAGGVRFLASFAVATLGLSCAAPSEHRDVSYDDRFGDSTTMDLYLPSGTSPRPAILMIHGGAWRTGSKQHYHDAAVRMARSGYVAAAINYRLAAWVRPVYRLDWTVGWMF